MAIDSNNVGGTLNIALKPYLRQPAYGNLNVVSLVPSEFDVTGEQIGRFSFHGIKRQVYEVSYNRVMGESKTGFLVYSPADEGLIHAVDFPSIGTRNITTEDQLIEILLKVPKLIDSERISDLIAHAHSQRIAGVPLEKAVAGVETFALENPGYGPVAEEIVLYNVLGKRIWDGDFSRVIKDTAEFLEKRY